MATTMSDVTTAAQKAKVASSVLARTPAGSRQRVLALIADRLKDRESEILEANQKDTSHAERLVAKGELSTSLLHRLKLDSAKLADLASGIRQLSEAEDLLGKNTLSRELDVELNLYRVTCPIGVIGVIFESRPDALPQITALCIKSGNAFLLKGGSEAQNSNLKLFELIDQSLKECGFPPHTATLLESRKDVEEMLKADRLIDLIIPRGSNELVRHIQNNTRIPVLGHAEGVCHIYIDKQADPKKALEISIDAKVQYPAACNAVETLLLHKDLGKTLLPEIVDELLKQNVVVKVDKESEGFLAGKRLQPATTEDWQKEYCDLVLSVRTVDSIEQAIEHINLYGSGHTEAIITEDASAADQFVASVNSAGVYINASTRFADGFRYGFGAEVGISTGKLHPRGPVGVEGLVTYKYKLVGSGQIVRDYVGKSAKKFTHKEIGH